MTSEFHHFQQNASVPTEARRVERAEDLESCGLESEPEPMQRGLESDDRDGFSYMRFNKDDAWEVFIPDDDEIDPQPEPGDFWIDPDE